MKTAAVVIGRATEIVGRTPRSAGDPLVAQRTPPILVALNRHAPGSSSMTSGHSRIHLHAGPDGAAGQQKSSKADGEVAFGPGGGVPTGLTSNQVDGDHFVIRNGRYGEVDIAAGR